MRFKWFSAGIFLIGAFGQTSAFATESFVIQGMLGGAQTTLSIQREGEAPLHALYRAFPFRSNSLKFEYQDGQVFYQAHLKRDSLAEIHVHDPSGADLGWIREGKVANPEKRYFELFDVLNQKTVRCLIYLAPKKYTYFCFADKKVIARAFIKEHSITEPPFIREIRLEILTNEISSPLLISWISSHVAIQSSDIFWKTQKDRWLIPGVGIGAVAAATTYAVVRPHAQMGGFSLRDMRPKDLFSVRQIVQDPVNMAMSGDRDFVTNATTKHFVVVTQERKWGIPREKVIGVFSLGHLVPGQRYLPDYRMPPEEVARAKTYWIAYSFAKEYWGKGIGTRMLSEVKDIAFQRLGITHLLTTALRSNFGSQRILIKNHFSQYFVDWARIYYHQFNPLQPKRQIDWIFSEVDLANSVQIAD